MILLGHTAHQFVFVARFSFHPVHVYPKILGYVPPSQVFDSPYLQAKV
jgi:hypothetical protein